MVLFIHMVLFVARMGSSDCWGFVCVIVGSLLQSTKHFEMTLGVSWYCLNKTKVR